MKWLILNYILLCSSFVFAQQQESFDSTISLTYYPPLTGEVDRVFFPGGDGELYEFLARNTHYPKEARKQHVDSSVGVMLTFDTLGNIIDARIKWSVGYGCDEEALRIVRMMPRWNRENVRANSDNLYYLIPIWFPSKKIKRERDGSITIE